MVLSRQQNAAALDHILTEVFGLNPDAPLQLALQQEGISNVSEFLTMDDAEIDDLTFTRPGETDESPVPRGHRRIITVFFDYIKYRVVKNNPIGDAWVTIKQEDFDEF